MSPQFEGRLLPRLQKIAAEFGTPFHIYDEEGIRVSCRYMKSNLGHAARGYRNFFAVKALPNPTVLKVLREEGCGFDCSSIMEVQLALAAGAEPGDIMFTSNNTTHREFSAAREAGGILNLDDVSFLKNNTVTPSRETGMSFRINPGAAREGTAIIGKPEEAKYGIMPSQIADAYRHLRDEWLVERFGIHTMVASNQRDWRYMVATVKMLLGWVAELEKDTGIRVEWMNMGGGFGIPYKPGHAPLDLTRMVQGIARAIAEFETKHGWSPLLYSESGRYVTGPSGVLVTTAINRKEIWQTHVGVDASMSALMRPGIYGVYHHVTVPFARRPKSRERVNIVGPICENCDMFAVLRVLPTIGTGDLVLVHDTGAHGLAMGFNYNGRTRPQELLLRSDGAVELIRRAETEDDLWRTLRFEPVTLSPASTAP